MFRPIFPAILLILIAGMLLSPMTTAATRGSLPVLLDRAMIVVDDNVITQGEVEARVQATRANLKRRNIAIPPNTVVRRQVIDTLILEQIQLDLAEKRGIQVNKTEIDQALEGLARQNKRSVASFVAQIRKNGVSRKMLREDIHKQLILRKLIDIEINRQIRISENEIDVFLKEQSKRGVNVRYNLSHILVAIPAPAARDDRRKAAALAAKIRQKLLDGESFEKLAITHSKGPNALKGGSLGWRKAGRVPELFVHALENLSKGGITPVLESASGYHVLRLNDKSGDSANTVVTQTRVRHILLKPSAVQTLEDATQKLQRLRNRVLAGTKFEELARIHSEDKNSAAQGGDLGWINPGQAATEFERAMTRLQPGELSRPVQTRFGIHLIQVVNRRNKDLGDERLRLDARRQIHQRKAEEKLQQWLRELRDQAYVEVIPPETD